ACVLLFALGRPALPVDTHVYRVTQRLGIAAPNANPVKVQEELERTVAPEDQYLYHILLIRHGRHMCTARAPDCWSCPLSDRCPSSRARSEPGSVTASKPD